MISPKETIVTRKEAKSLGLRRYFTGAPCVKGHIAERHTTDKTCIECKRERASLPKNRASKARREARPKHKTRRAANMRRLREQDPEGYRARQNAWMKLNIGRVRRYSRDWNKRNKLYRRAQQAARRSNEGSYSSNDVLDIYRKQKGRCAACGVKLRRVFDVDHIVPLKRGGTSWPRNLQLLCRTCNRSKKDRDPLDYAKSRGLLV